MTSSLVGSEMCIRDRSYLVTTSEVQSGNTPILWHTAMIFCRLFKNVSFCLLYTSDAADDM
eukprot:12443482-Prorocentrum_lima.AAC.1